MDYILCCEWEGTVWQRAKCSQAFCKTSSRQVLACARHFRGNKFMSIRLIIIAKYRVSCVKAVVITMPNQSPALPRTKAKPDAHIKTIQPPQPSAFFTPALVPSLGTPAVATAVPVAAQLAVPQLYPLGQQLPPRLAAQLYHPVAHVPVLRLVPVVVRGTMMVRPLETSVSEDVARHDVVSQFLPVRQHPPA